MTQNDGNELRRYTFFDDNQIKKTRKNCLKKREKEEKGK